jgi:hypothetical protein
MVTAETGRTAPTPPRPAPVIEVSAGTLRRATGHYASSSAGLYTVTAAGGGLQVTPTPLGPDATPLTLLPRANGWYAAPHPPAAGDPLATAWFKPATIAGRHLLLAHFDRALGPEPNGVVTTFAEKIPSSYRIPQAWRARAGKYRATNIIPDTEAALPRTVNLTIDHGVLVWNDRVVAPAGPTRAFTLGLTPVLVARGAGDTLIASGNTLTSLGITYQKVNPS